MIDVKELVLISEPEEAKKISILGSNGDLEVYVISQRTGVPYQLTIGDLDNIRSEIPKKVVIEVGDFLQGYFQKVSYLDLRIKKLKHSELFSKIDEKNPDNATLLSKSPYWVAFEKQLNTAVSAYPNWAESCIRGRKQIKKEVIKAWLKDRGSDDRQAEIIKNILSDIYLKSDK